MIQKYTTQYKMLTNMSELNDFLTELGEDVISVRSEYNKGAYETRHYIHYKVYIIPIIPVETEEEKEAKRENALG